MSKQKLVSAMCDLFGYAASDFNHQTSDEIWWYLEDFERAAINEYVEVENALRATGIN